MTRTSGSYETLNFTRRLKVLALSGAVSLAVSACSGAPGTTASQPSGTPGVDAAPAATATAEPLEAVSTATPTVTASPTPTAVPNTTAFIERPLAELSAEAVAYMQTREGPAGVAVVVPSAGVIYTLNGHEMFHMASVAKVGIMLTLMNQALEANRDLTPAELEKLRPMITVSDNVTASELWGQIGGGQAVEDYFRSLGLQEIDPNKETCWGASYASAHDVALLLAKLANGEILDDAMRDTALGLMQEVDPSQTWGVIAARPETMPEGTIAAVKDGWYPADCGWWVNSAGILIPGDERPAYTIAVLTGEQSTWEYGIQTIEGVGELVHAAMHGEQ